MQRSIDRMFVGGFIVLLCISLIHGSNTTHPNNTTLTMQKIVPPEIFANVTLGIIEQSPLPLVSYEVTLDPIFNLVSNKIFLEFTGGLEKIIERDSTDEPFSGSLDLGDHVPINLSVISMDLLDKDITYYYHLSENDINSNAITYDYGQSSDYDAPVLHSFTINTTQVHYTETVKITANITDESALDTIWLDFGLTDSWSRFTTIGYNTTSGLYEKILAFDDTDPETIIFEGIDVEDEWGNEFTYDGDEGIFDTFNITVTGTYQTPPQFVSFEFNQTSVTLNEEITINVNITDPYPDELYVDANLYDGNGLTDFEVDLDYDSTSGYYTGTFVMDEPNYPSKLYVKNIEISIPGRANLLITPEDHTFPTLDVVDTTPTTGEISISNVTMNATSASLTDFFEVSWDITGHLPDFTFAYLQFNHTIYEDGLLFKPYATKFASPHVSFVFRPLMIMSASIFPFYRLPSYQWLEEIGIESVLVEDNTFDGVESVNGVDFNIPSLTITYPESWIQEIIEPSSSETSSGSGTTNSDTTNSDDNSKGGTLPISLSVLYSSFIVLIIYTRFRKHLL